MWEWVFPVTNSTDTFAGSGSVTSVTHDARLTYEYVKPV